MLRRLPSSPETAEALAAGLEDHDPAVALVAARAAPERGRSAAARIAGAPVFPPELRAEALSILGGVALDPEVEAAIRGAHRAREPQVVRAAIDAAVRAGLVRAASELHLLASRADEDLAVRAIDALGALGAPGEERRYLAMLSGPPAVRAAAARVLAGTGSPRALPALLEASRGVALAPSARSAILAAIEALRRRHALFAGEVSLVDAGPTDGALSLPPEEGGLSLSLDEDPGPPR
jgi:HEAT repeat protein